MLLLVQLDQKACIVGNIIIWSPAEFVILRTYKEINSL